MHEFKSDFYGHDMQAVVLGYIRPELDYTSRGQCIIMMFPESRVSFPLVLSEALIEDINTDKRVALNSLSREAYMKFGVDPNPANGTYNREERSLL